MKLASVAVTDRVASRVDLSIIIVNYNGERFVGRCLDQLLSTASAAVEIIVTDNCSSDQSLEVLRAFGDRIKLVTSTANSGFAGGVNLAVAEARGRWLMLLNPDTSMAFDPAELLARALSHPHIGVLGPRIRYPDGRQQFSFGFEHTVPRIVLAWLGGDRIALLTSCFSLQERRLSHYESIRDVDWVSGCCLLTPRALWHAIGGLDEQFFMYVEDVDYCRRVREEGYRVVYDPTLELAHEEGGSVSGFNRAAIVRSCSSYLRYTRKWSGRVATVALRGMLGMAMLLRGFGALLLEQVHGKAWLSERRRAYLQIGADLLAGRIH